MTDACFELGDKVRIISTGEWATIAGTSKSPLGLQYFLSVRGVMNGATGEPYFHQIGPIAAEDVEARDDATSGAPTPPIPPVPSDSIPDDAEGAAEVDGRDVATGDGSTPTVAPVPSPPAPDAAQAGAVAEQEGAAATPDAAAAAVSADASDRAPSDAPTPRRGQQ